MKKLNLKKKLKIEKQIKMKVIAKKKKKKGHRIHLLLLHRQVRQRHRHCLQHRRCRQRRQKKLELKVLKIRPTTLQNWENKVLNFRQPKVGRSGRTRLTEKKEKEITAVAASKLARL